MRSAISVIEGRRAGIAAVSLAALAAFANTLSFGFVWDDTIYLMKVEAYRAFDLRTIFLSLGNGFDYLPVRDVSFALDFLIWGDWPFGFHLTNVLLYALTTVFVFLMTERLVDSSGESSAAGPLGPTSFALMVALLFAVNPLHSEVVSFVSHRNYVLSGAFIFAGSYFYLGHLARDAGARGLRPWRDYALALFCFVLAVLSKQSAIVVPVLYALMLLSRPARGSLRREALLLVPLFLLSVGAYFLFKFTGESSGAIARDHLAFGYFEVQPKVARAVQIPFFYLHKFLYPSALSAEHTMDFQGSFLDAAPAAAGLALVAISAIALYLWQRGQRGHLVSFSLAWFLVSLVPFLNFYYTNPVVADRYAYLASYGFILGCVALISPSFKTTVVRPMIALIGVVFVIWGALAVTTNMVWRSDEAFFSNTARHEPKNLKALISLGNMAFEKGDMETAFRHFRRIEEISPPNAVVDYYMGVAAYERGDYEGALKHLEVVLSDGRTMPLGNVQAQHFLAGLVYEALGRRDEAIEKYLDVRNSLDKALVDTRRSAEERISALQAGVLGELGPEIALAEAAGASPRMKADLALKLDKAGLYDKALHFYEDAERSGGGHWALYSNMGSIYKKKGEIEHAVRYYLKSIELEPRNPATLNNLGECYKRLGLLDKAAEAYEQALAVDPDHKYAAFNLAFLYYQLGDRIRARKYAEYTNTRFPDMRGKVDTMLDAVQNEK